MKRLLTTLALLCAAGCGLTEVALVPEVDALVVEASFQWRETGQNKLLVWVHRSLGPGAQGPVQARVVMGLASADSVVLNRGEAVEVCVSEAPEGVGGSCYQQVGGVLETVEPGERLTLRVTTPTGEVVEGVTTVPLPHELVSAEDRGECVLPPDTPIRLGWTRAEGAWAYVNETLIYGLPDALAPLGIEVDDDPLGLLGLSISSADTTVVFPGEFGVFQRADLDQALAVALQSGLPTGTYADVLVGAADRNLVNWARGGGFNPSGQVRVPSLRGDGTGFFGSSVLREFRILVRDALLGVPACQSVGAVFGDG